MMRSALALVLAVFALSASLGGRQQQQSSSPRTGVTEPALPPAQTSSPLSSRTVSTTAPLAGGGTLAGDLTITCATCTTNASTLTPNLPVIGGGSNAVSVGTRSGSTTEFVTSTGGKTTAKHVQWDGSGNLSVTAVDLGTTILGRLNSANMNSTSDQPISIWASKYIIRKIVATNASASLTTAVGGFYTGAGKTGTIAVAAIQTYVALTGSTKFVDLTLAGGVTGDVLTASTIFLSLTVAQGSAATADIYILGDALP